MRNGIEVASATLSAITWHPLSRLRLSVGLDQAGASLSVSDSNSPDVVGVPVDAAGLLNGTLTVKTFNPGDGTTLFPHYLFPDLDTWE